MSVIHIKNVNQCWVESGRWNPITHLPGTIRHERYKLSQTNVS